MVWHFQHSCLGIVLSDTFEGGLGGKWELEQATQEETCSRAQEWNGLSLSQRLVINPPSFSSLFVKLFLNFILFTYGRALLCGFWGWTQLSMFSGSQLTFCGFRVLVSVTSGFAILAGLLSWSSAPCHLEESAAWGVPISGPLIEFWVSPNVLMKVEHRKFYGFVS